ncbi:hypothetical protein V2A60_009824 [Cordyceps javanica]
MTSMRARPDGPGTGSAPTYQTVTARLGDILEQNDYDFDRIPAQLSQQGQGWHAIFNPDASRQISLQLVKEFDQQSSFHITDIEFSPDGRYLAWRNGGAAHVCAADNQRGWPTVGDFPDSSISHGVWPEGPQPLSFSPDGTLVATGGEECHVLIWSVEDGSCKHKIPAHNGGVRSLAFSKEGNVLASGGGDDVVCLWDVSSGELVDEIAVEGVVYSTAWSPDGKLLAASSGSDITVWDAGTKAVLRRFGADEHGHSDLVASLVFSPCGKKLISGGFDNLIKVWSLEGDEPREWALSLQLEGQEGLICSLAVTPDGEWLLSGSKARNLMFWNLQDGHAQVLLSAFKNTVTGIDVSLQDGLIATSCADGIIRLWSYEKYDTS